MKHAIFNHMSVVITSSWCRWTKGRRVSSSLPMGKYRRGICPAVLPLCSALCLSHSVYSSIFFLENTTIPNLHEVKENMTMGTTLVTNPNGGFLVREEFLFVIYKRAL